MRYDADDENAWSAALKAAMTFVVLIAIMLGLAYLVRGGADARAGAMDATVKVEIYRPAVAAQGDKPARDRMPAGHGSATHIGNGYLITAAHVVAGNAMEYDLRNQAGVIERAEVLWINERYDIALLRVPEDNLYGVVDLSCERPEVGDELTLRGNPLQHEFQTTYARVSGEMASNNMWHDAQLIDGTLVMGMSGGGVYNAHGQLAGVIVGATVAQLGMGGLSLTGLNVIVPGDVVCGLMGRGV